MARLGLALLGIGFLFATHCSSRGATPDPSASGSATTDGPWGRDFLSTQILEGGRPRPLARDSRVRLEFRDNHELYAYVGCNHLRGQARLEGTQLVATIDTTTLMGCHEDLHALDEWLKALLNAKPTFVLRGNDLTLTSAATEVHLQDRRIADPDRPLVGTRWTLESLIVGAGPSGSVQSVPEHGAYFLFGADHRFKGSSGCNEFNGTFVQPAPDKLTFSAYTITEKGCNDDTTRVERILADVFKDLATLKITARSANIESPRGRGVGLRASP